MFWRFVLIPMLTLLPVTGLVASAMSHPHTLHPQTPRDPRGALEHLVVCGFVYHPCLAPLMSCGRLLDNTRVRDLTGCSR